MDIRHPPGLEAPPHHSDLAAARFEYISGRYDAAIEILETIVAASQLRPLHRARALECLSLALFQSNRYDAEAVLPRRDPLTRLMRAFVEPPNRVDFRGADSTALPFLQYEEWELPRVSIAVNGRPLVAALDTGGDLLSIPWPLTENLGIEPVAITTGRFAGGHRARTGFARVDEVALGEAIISNVPVSINRADRPLVGTGLLRQFLPTIDYPGARLLLRPRGRGAGEDGFPFWLVHTHLLIAAGSLHDVPMRFLVDSGLEADNGACFAAPDTTLMRVGIPIPRPTPSVGSSGAGTAKLRLGEFAISTIGLGSAYRTDQLGLTGIFPRQLTRPATMGLPVAGLVSHNFLRHYRWTIDFDRMLMTLAP